MNSDETPKTDSAFVLQWDEAARQQVIFTLVYEKYPQLKGFFSLYLPDEESAARAARKTISQAAKRRKQYQGQSSASTWLFKLAVQQEKPAIPGLRGVSGLLSRPLSPFHPAYILQAHYGLDIEQISYALGWRGPRTRRILKAIEKHFDHSQSEEARSTHPSQPGLSVDEAETIAGLIIAEYPEESRSSPGLTRELGILGVLLGGLLIGLAILRANNPLSEGVSLFPTPQPPTPTAIQGGAFRESADSPRLLQNIENTEPELSSDGSVLVFASNSPIFAVDDRNHFQDIFTLDLTSHTITRITVGPDGQESNGWSFNPSISGDGNRIVFASSAGNLVPQEIITCPRENPLNPCINIYLHERETGETRLVSTGPDGWGGNLNSLAPSISEDGGWVVFWSQATNFGAENVFPDIPGCNLQELIYPCLDVYLYQVETGNAFRIPVGRNPQLQFDLESLAVSRNGKFLLVPIFQTDQIAGGLDFQAEADLFILDMNTFNFEPVNVNSNEEHGNRIAHSANMTPDGRYVVFSSPSTNLVPGDENQAVDVFLRDRVKRWMASRETVTVALAYSELFHPEIEQQSQTMGGLSFTYPRPPIWAGYHPNAPCLLLNRKTVIRCMSSTEIPGRRNRFQTSLEWITFSNSQPSRETGAGIPSRSAISTAFRSARTSGFTTC
jgi:hypothetical protein